MVSQQTFVLARTAEVYFIQVTQKDKKLERGFRTGGWSVSRPAGITLQNLDWSRKFNLHFSPQHGTPERSAAIVDVFNRTCAFAAMT